MTTLGKRIKALENRILVDADEQPEGVFCYCIDGRIDAPAEPLPVNGWQHGSDRIMREAGETDEELEKRAIAQVRPGMGKMRSLFFTQ